MKYIVVGFIFAFTFLFSCQDANNQGYNNKLSFAGSQTSNNDSAAKRISPLQKAAGLVGNTVVKVDYSAPNIKGRIIWGGLVPYGEVWRTGANEATVVSLEKDVLVGGEKLTAGKYSLYTIPNEKNWIVIFNHIWDQWGTEYNEAHDALRIEVKPKNIPQKKEQLEIKVESEQIVIRWDNIQVPIPLESAPMEEA